MSEFRTLKRALIGTTALIGVMLLASPPAAQAASFNFSTTGNPAQTMGNGDTGVVTGTGGITSGATAVTVTDGATASSISNSGVIQATGADFAGILIKQSATISGAITNSGNIEGGTGIFVSFAGADIAGGVSNSGTIHGGFTGISLTSGGLISGGIDNTGTISGGTHGIDNHGTISNSGTAILVHSNGTISGGVANSGLIHGTGMAGAPASTGGTGAGIVVNSGTITGGIVNNGGTISGQGGVGGTSITGAAGGQGIGIDITSGTVDSITNDGTISGQGGMGGTGAFSLNGPSGSGIGIYLNSSGTITGSIVNTGTISGSTHGIKNDGMISSTGVHGTSCAACTAGNGGGASALSLSNSGTITGGIEGSGTFTGTGGDGGNVTAGLGTGGGGGQGIGINMNGASSITQGIVLSGTISGHGGNGGGGFIGGIGGQGIGINIAGSGTISDSIVNTGTISGQGGTGGNGFAGGNGGAGTGINLGGNAVISGGIVNGGTISGAGGAGGAGVGVGMAGRAVGIFVDASASIAGGILNTGTISGASAGIENHGTISNTAGAAITVQSGGAITGGIVNSSTIQGSGGTAISLNALAAALPIEIDGGQIIGDVTDDNPDAGFSPVTIGGVFSTGGNFTVSDLIIQPAGALTISPGNTFTASTMTGGTGTLTFGITNFATFGKLVVHNAGNTGAINLSGLTVTVSAATANLNANDQILVGHGDVTLTGIAGTPGQALTAVTDNSALWNFKMVDGSDTTDLIAPTTDADLWLIASRNNNGFADTTGNANIESVLENTVFTDPTLLQIQGNLNAASNADQVNDILSSAGPTVNGSDLVASQNLAGSTETFTGDRLSALRTGEDASGMAAGDMMRGTGAWGEVFGQHSDQNDRDNIAGYTANTWGAALGLDTRNVSDKAVLGLGFSYGRTTANSDNSNSTDTDVDSYEITMYGSYNFDHDTYVNGVAGYTWGNVDTDRHNVGGVTGLTAHGKYNTQQFSAQAEAGRDFAVNHMNGMILTPNLTADWVNWDPDSYRETGAGGADLSVNGRTLNRVDVGGGVKAGWSFKNGDGSWIKPQLRAGYKYAVTDDQIVDVAQFTGGGGAFAVPGPNPARGALDLGASVKLLTTQNWTFTGSYDFDWRSDYTASAGFIRAGYRF